MADKNIQKNLVFGKILTTASFIIAGILFLVAYSYAKPPYWGFLLLAILLFVVGIAAFFFFGYIEKKVANAMKVIENEKK